jgi:4-amino-4-deoxy-L-arabinose transferase-like glycosyltransferase
VLPSPEQGRSIANALLGLLVASFFVALFNHGLVPSMEPRFAEVVREMIAANEYLIPLKNGRPYVEYPIFYYWLAIAGKSAGLPMTAAIRLPTFAAFFGWLYVLGRWWRQLPMPFPPWVVQLIAAALPIVLFQFSIAQTDSLLAFGVMLAMYGYTRLVKSQGFVGFPWALWTGVSTAMLAKGPVGIACTLPIIFLDRLVDGWNRADFDDGARRTGRLHTINVVMRPVGWIRGILLVSAVSMPWYVLAGYDRGWDFVEATLVYQNFDRYVTGYSHLQPWWYYFKTLCYDFFPISILLPFGVWHAAKQSKQTEYRLPFLWALFTFVFFTLSGSKQGKYLLPMTPAIVALAFVELDFIQKQYGRKLWRLTFHWSIGMLSVFAILILIVLPKFSDRLGGINGYIPIKHQLEKEPGQLIHYHWPRSLTLYELGAPMRFVRSSRDLYRGIASGAYVPGDYVLVEKHLLGGPTDADTSGNLTPFPRPAVFEVVLETEIEKAVVLLRIRPGAAQASVPDTPEPPVVNWRDAVFDTD